MSCIRERITEQIAENEFQHFKMLLQSFFIFIYKVEIYLLERAYLTSKPIFMYINFIIFIIYCANLKILILPSSSLSHMQYL